MTNDYDIVQIKDGIQTAFIDYNYNSSLAYRPQFVSNNYKEGKTVGIHIEPGPDGGIVEIDDTTVLDRALQILADCAQK